MNKRRYRLWIALFIGVALILATLATLWNFVLVRDYHRMIELAHAQTAPMAHLITGLVLGTLGFFAVLGVFILFFIRLLREMKANQQQSEFLATVTHELKTPIAAIELASSLLREGKLSLDEEEKLWSSHQAELSRLRSEVESLLEAARWDAMPVDVETQKINLDAWIAESMTRWRSILGPGAELTRDGAPLSWPVMLDLKKLNLICDNILANSRKYAKGTPRVVVRTSRVRPSHPLLGSRDRWQIQFEDQGWGFDPKEAKKILKPFYRSKSQLPYAIPGAGLGLYIASSASEALGMKMRGQSPGHGHGATFSIEGEVGPEGDGAHQ
jgi:signal transduction histidine kinase